MIAPASLKLGAFWARLGAREATPGHDCPGLIEAVVGSGRPVRKDSPLRGMIAPASLKRFAEARVEELAHHPLRGMIAPASLKHQRPPAPILRQPGPLRGMIAPASLKQCEVVLSVGEPTDHSGA